MEVAHAFRLQSAACEHMGSPLYARLLAAAVEDLEAEGAVSKVVSQWNRNPMDDAVPLRLMGGVHRIVLSGREPALAAHYPTAGGSPGPGCEGAFLATIARNVDELRSGMLHPPQTNEVGRAGVLLGGLLEIARLTRKPIRLLEFGASAGLNLRLDHYAYDFGENRWGHPSPVQVETAWRGDAPDLATPLVVAHRAGCDATPIDITDPEQADRLASFVWADQVDRFQRIRAAIALAPSIPVTLDASGADTWLARRLADPVPGVVTVVMHSAVMQYLDRTARTRLESMLHDAASRASAEAPFARLSFEPGDRYFALRLRLAPRHVTLTLADAHPHGTWAEWFVGSGRP